LVVRQDTACMFKHVVNHRMAAVFASGSHPACKRRPFENAL